MKVKHLLYTRFCLMALINCLLRLSALALFNDITAHSAAGNQPMSVICKNRQTMAEMILPLKKKERKGTNMANSIGILFTDVNSCHFLCRLLFTLSKRLLIYAADLSSFLEYSIAALLLMSAPSTPVFCSLLCCAR